MQAVFTSYASTIIATDSNALSMESDTTQYNISTYTVGGAFASAVHWLWALILSLCGISVSNTSDIDSIASEISTWAQGAGKPNIYAQLIVSITKASWGATVDNLKDMVAMVKTWLKEKSDGYGTDTGIKEIVYSPTGRNFTDSYSYEISYTPSYSADSYFNTATWHTTRTYYLCDYFLDLSDKNRRIAFYYDSLNSYRVCEYNLLDKSFHSDSDKFTAVEYIRDDSHVYYFAQETPMSFYRFDTDNENECLSAVPVPVYSSSGAAKSYCETGVIGKTLNNYVADNERKIPVISNPTVQQKDLDTAGTLTIPADADTASGVYEQVGQAADIDALTKALAAYVALTYKSQQDTTDNVNTITKILTLINEKISEWDIDIWKDSLSSVLNSLGIDALSNSLDNISHWSIDTWINGATKTITDALSNLGINDLTGKLDSILSWDFADWTTSLSDVLKKIFDTPLDIITVKISNLAGDIAKALNLSALIDGIKEKIISGINALENIYDYLISLSLSGLLVEIINLIKAIPKTIVDELNQNPSNKGDENDKSFHNFIDFIVCLVYIILLLIMIFANCIRLIISIFSIPASSSLFNDDVLKGLQYTKDLMIPKFNISLYSLLTGIAFFLCVMSIIGLLKKRIDKLRE